MASRQSGSGAVSTEPVSRGGHVPRTGSCSAGCVMRVLHVGREEGDDEVRGAGEAAGRTEARERHWTGSDRRCAFQTRFGRWTFGPPGASAPGSGASTPGPASSSDGSGTPTPEPDPVEPCALGRRDAVAVGTLRGRSGRHIEPQARRRVVRAPRIRREVLRRGAGPRRAATRERQPGGEHEPQSEGGSSGGPDSGRAPGARSRGPLRLPPVDDVSSGPVDGLVPGELALDPPPPDRAHHDDDPDGECGQQGQAGPRDGEEARPRRARDEREVRRRSGVPRSSRRRPSPCPRGVPPRREARSSR